VQVHEIGEELIAVQGLGQDRRRRSTNDLVAVEAQLAAKLVANALGAQANALDDAARRGGDIDEVLAVARWTAVALGRGRQHADLIGVFGADRPPSMPPVSWFSSAPLALIFREGAFLDGDFGRRGRGAEEPLGRPALLKAQFVLELFDLLGEFVDPLLFLEAALTHEDVFHGTLGLRRLAWVLRCIDWRRRSRLRAPMSTMVSQSLAQAATEARISRSCSRGMYMPEERRSGVRKVR
jgi:hypothetical protein